MIPVDKLSELAKLSRSELLRALILIKYKSQQYLRYSDSIAPLTSEKDGGMEEYFHTDGVFESISDLHFYLENDCVNVDEKQKKQKFADFFLQNALKLGQCYSDLRSNNLSSKTRSKVFHGKRKK